jgi:molybdopterin synthase catalytic subunit
MRISLLFFGPVRDLTGKECVDQELPAGANIDALAADLAERYPALRAGMPALRFAVNQEFAGGQRVLAEGDEVAVIPPVSGG